MARKRKNSWLPKGVYVGRSAYVIKYHDGVRRTERPLCPLTCQASIVWQRWEEWQAKTLPSGTVRWLFEQYLAGDAFAKLKPRTQQDYKKYAASIIAQKLKDNREFGDVALSEITPGVIQKWHEARGKAAKAQPNKVISKKGATTQANREKSFFSLAFSWARSRDLTPPGMANPCAGVRRHTEKARTRYVSEADYSAALAAVDTREVWYLRPAMELAYLCRLRKSEVLGLRRSDLLPEGLLCRRRKGSKDAITLWSDRLRSAVAICTGKRRAIDSVFLFADDSGQQLKVDAFDSAWQRVMSVATFSRFTFHDLKAKGVSDAKGDKQRASGHRTAAMVAVYDRKLMVVEPTE